MVQDTDDKDLSVAQAALEEMRTCSVDSGSDFHLLQFLKRVAVVDHHDDLIREILRRKTYARMPHHRELADEVVRSLERKKAETTVSQSDAAFVSALGDDGEGETRSRD